MQSIARPMLAVACTNDRDRFRVRQYPIDGRLNPERPETGSQWKVNSVKFMFSY